MLSSTFFDLQEKRRQVLGFMGRHEFHDIAMESDAALSTLDKIDSSLDKVERADAYICIIGYRYGTREFCETRNPENLSLTELEWRRARERGIPRCTFIMSPKYSGIPLAEMEAVSAEDRQSLAAFRKLAESDKVYASFDDDTDFQVKAMQSLEQLRPMMTPRVAGIIGKVWTDISRNLAQARVIVDGEQPIWPLILSMLRPRTLGHFRTIATTIIPSRASLGRCRNLFHSLVVSSSPGKT
jgi:hypothetical protein